MKYGRPFLAHYAHFLQKILLYILFRAVLVRAHVGRLLYNLSILTKSIPISVNVIPQRLLRILPPRLQSELHSAKEGSIRSQLLADLLVDILLSHLLLIIHSTLINAIAHSYDLLLLILLHLEIIRNYIKFKLSFEKIWQR